MEERGTEGRKGASRGGGEAQEQGSRGERASATVEPNTGATDGTSVQ